MPKSKIQWTDATLNCVTGCTKISDGCKNCYALMQSFRNSCMGIKKYCKTVIQKDDVIQWTGEIRIHQEVLEEPRKRKKPTRYFINSMSDTFHPGVPDDFLFQIFGMIADCPQHQFLILTKRPERMCKFMTAPPPIEAQKLIRDIVESKGYKVDAFPHPHLWLGVTCENQEQADKRIPWLLKTPAFMRFVSAEPLLSAIDFKLGLTLSREDWRQRGEQIDQIIVGGESGPHARPMHPKWARDIRDQCQESSTAFFMKQFGAWIPKEMKIPETKYSEWGLLRADGTYMKETTTWNGRQNDPEDDYEVTIFKTRSHNGDIDEFPVDLQIREAPIDKEIQR